MKVNDRAVVKWNEICKKQEGFFRTQYKILRAVVMGKVVMTFTDGDYVVRYFDISVYVSRHGEVLNLWRTVIGAMHGVPYDVKNEYDRTTSHKRNLINAKRKHRRTLKRIADGFVV